VERLEEEILQCCQDLNLLRRLRSIKVASLLFCENFKDDPAKAIMQTSNLCFGVDATLSNVTWN
jgi:hypothetical protein